MKEFKRKSENTLRKFFYRKAFLNLKDKEKAAPRGKFISIQAFLSKKIKLTNKQLTLQSKGITNKN